MIKIYVSHSTGFDFEKELYRPLKRLEGFELVFPHEASKKLKSSKEILRECSAVIADISHPSHGVGVEIGWADSFEMPIIFIFKKGAKVSSSLKLVSGKFIEYEKVEDILEKIEEILRELMK